MPKKEFERAKHSPPLKGAQIIMSYADFIMKGPLVARLTKKEKDILQGDLEDAAEMERRRAERRK